MTQNETVRGAPHSKSETIAQKPVTALLVALIGARTGEQDRAHPVSPVDGLVASY